MGIIVKLILRSIKEKKLRFRITMYFKAFSFTFSINIFKAFLKSFFNFLKYLFNFLNNFFNFLKNLFNILRICLIFLRIYIIFLRICLIFLRIHLIFLRMMSFRTLKGNHQDKSLKFGLLVVRMALNLTH